ncbi:YjgN family protein [Solilutibacter tolerans]|uniref:Uncharacterized membrane protein YjgN, DUF898 family n=1 Tax=Solilutibacter tolerans TaxID=1604334 RepID=A0A1N6T8G3_9GAMM|nr:YjgN family protein [Lysobacter tolerans]SIQ49517.1 Uncharacterized membrane protein YjgN, DUF898 family [Lysobacter tolerans]
MEYRIWPDAEPGPAPHNPPPLPERRHKPVFSGHAGEYFGIWIVNVVLSILTLGIYSAWAKVRTERYFYSNTRLAGSAFEYTADPIAILKGRLIAYAVVITLALTSNFMPALYFLLIMAVGLLMPMIIVWSLRFRARNSVWRGLSFRFDQPAGDAYMPFLMWNIITSMTLTLLYPMASAAKQQFVVEGHRFGVKRFAFKGESSQYYPAYFVALGLGILAIIIGVMLVGAYTAATKSSGSEDKEALLFGMMMFLFVFYGGLFFVMTYLRVRYTNLMWQNTSLMLHRFESTLRVRDVTWIYLSNIVAILFTLGLAVPWAMVRLARYRAEHFTLIATGDLDEFAAASQMHAGATGAELVDALDAGLDFGI